MGLSLIECYNNYLGAGNPDSKYWFIGLEPGGDSSDFNAEIDWNARIDEDTTYYHRIFTFKSKILNKQDQEYGNIVIDKTSDILISNIFPLNFKNEHTYEDAYKNHFSDMEHIVNKIDYYNFILKNSQTRAKNINSILSDNAKNIFVIGFQTLEYFCCIMKLKLQKEKVPIEINWTEKSKTQINVYQTDYGKLFVMPHLSYWHFMSNALTPEVVSKIQSQMLK